MTDKTTPRVRPDDDLPVLPPLDDDGAAFDEGDASLGLLDRDRDEGGGLDDATGEREPIDAWIVGAHGAPAERGLLVDSDADESLVPHEDVQVGGERGQLEDSDEPDERAIGADEAGIGIDEESDGDDRGVEGTGEDPSVALDPELLRDPLTVGAPDDETVDSAFYESLEPTEREPWPSRADVAWTVEPVSPTPATTRASSPPPSLSIPVSDDTRVVVEGPIVVAARYGEPLAVSTDGGERFVRIGSCTSTTAVATIPGTPGGRAAVLALWDAARDSSALVMLRVVHGQPMVEIVADLATSARRDPEGDAEDDDDRARVDSLEVELVEGHVVVVARGRFGAVRARG